MAAPVWKLLDQPSYHFDPETKQQSMEWQHSGSPHPQKFQVQKSAGKVLTSIFWDQDSFIPIDCLPKGQTINVEYYLSFCWCNWRTFLRKNAAGMSPRGSCSCTTMPRLTGHLQPRRNWPTWAYNVLITHLILWIWPRRTTTCSLDGKNNWKVTIFHLTQRSLQPRRPGWMDNLLEFFLSGLQNLEQQAKKVYWASWGVCWINPEFGHCSLFPSWSG